MPDVRDSASELFDALNNRDWATIRGALHPHYIYTGPDGEEVRGVEAGLAVAWTDHAVGLPDVRVEVKSVYADGDVAITEFTFAGTHDGPWAGIAPTGKRVEASACNLMQFRDGKLYRERDYFDMLSILAQLGVVDVPQG